MQGRCTASLLRRGELVAGRSFFRLGFGEAIFYFDSI